MHEVSCGLRERKNRHQEQTTQAQLKRSTHQSLLVQDLWSSWGFCSLRCCQLHVPSELRCHGSSPNTCRYTKHTGLVGAQLENQQTRNSLKLHSQIPGIVLLQMSLLHLLTREDSRNRRQRQQASCATVARRLPLQNSPCSSHKWLVHMGRSNARLRAQVFSASGYGD